MPAGYEPRPHGATAASGLAAPELERTPPITDLLRVFRDWKRGLGGGAAGPC